MQPEEAIQPSVESVLKAQEAPTPTSVEPANEPQTDLEASFTEPTELESVESSFAGRLTKMAIARHNTSGTNRFGQDADGFPFCLLNMEAWHEAPFDLRIARWFRTEEEALNAAGVCTKESGANKGGKVKSPPTWSARFAGGIRVELRFEDGSRWVLWADRYGKLERCRDSATPYLAHAKRIAVHWFGDPITPWSPAT